jgi:hypothetical protein
MPLYPGNLGEEASVGCELYDEALKMEAWHPQSGVMLYDEVSKMEVWHP